MAEYKLNKAVGVVVIIVCLAAVLLIYHFTVGAKVSREAPVSPTTSQPGEVTPTPPGTGPGVSHAVPGPTETPVPKPAGDKKALPPEK
jgi:hypothetical protein